MNYSKIKFMKNSCVPSVASGKAERVFNSWSFVLIIKHYDFSDVHPSVICKSVSLHITINPLLHASCAKAKHELSYWLLVCPVNILAGQLTKKSCSVARVKAVYSQCR